MDNSSSPLRDQPNHQPNVHHRNSRVSGAYRVELTGCDPKASPAYIGKRCRRLKIMIAETVKVQRFPFWNKLVSTNRIVFAVPLGNGEFIEHVIYNDPREHRIITYSQNGETMRSGVPAWEVTVEMANMFLDEVSVYATAAQRIQNAWDAVERGFCPAHEIDIPKAPPALTPALKVVFGDGYRSLFFKLQARKLAALESIAAVQLILDEDIVTSQSMVAEFAEMHAISPIGSAMSRDLAGQVPLVSTPVEIPAEPNEAKTTANHEG